MSMTTTQLASESVWRKRLEGIPSRVDGIRMPEADNGNYNTAVDQSQEWCDVLVSGEMRRIRFHDYAEIYSVPGLYEELFYDQLKCCSPSCIVNLLKDVAVDHGEDLEDWTVLDVGAGNGMVGDELDHHGVKAIVGVDIIDKARTAALRDRPEVYDDYLVADLTDLPEYQEERLRKYSLNCLTTVAALGFGDVPPAAFVRALSMISTPGWLAFNIKESFLKQDDDTGFCGLIQRLCRDEYIQTQCYRRYCHRMSMAGEPLYYVAMICKKLRDCPADYA